VFSAIILKSHSLVKSEQKISEVFGELNASQTREKVVIQARGVDQATFEEATRRLESRVSSLEAELERSRQWYDVCSMSGFVVLTTSQRYPSEDTSTGTILSSITPRPNP
jgi:hypothetical protein